MSPPLVFFKVLFPGEGYSQAPVTIREGAEERLLG